MSATDDIGTPPEDPSGAVEERTFSNELEDIELINVQLTVANTRTLSDDASCGECQTVDTPHGPVVIAVSGDCRKPTIFTFHDIGLNHVTNFQAFFNYPDMKELLGNFFIVHINAPGQEDGGRTLPEGYIYPTMDELIEVVAAVKNHVQVRSFIGLGIGLGANILCRYALKYFQAVDALLLINCSSTKAGWIEWGYQKMNIRQLSSGTMTTGTVDYLLWHHFGKLEHCNQDLVTVFRQHFEWNLNPVNLALLLNSYIKRTDIGIVRELDPNKKNTVPMLKCSVLNMTSNYSPHIDDTVTFNSRLDPSNSTWMKVQDCGLLIDERPEKVAEAFKLFLQGHGYVIAGSRRSSAHSLGEAVHLRSIGSRQSSLASISVPRDIRITENPLEENSTG